jgi:hypothetical protein
MISLYIVKQQMKREREREREKDEGESDEDEGDPSIPNTSGPKPPAHTAPVQNAEP